MTQSQHESPAYSDDAPKIKIDDDALGYAPFAKRLAEVIRDLEAPNGYVIGLHGPWGSGKTTALNFIEFYLRQPPVAQEKSAPTLVHFRPWIVSGHQDLVSAFFKVFSEAIDADREHSTEKDKRAKERLRAALDPLVKGLSTLANLADPTSLTSRILGSMSKAAFDKTFDAWLKEPSLQSSHDTLKKILGDLNRRFVIVIDDIDRLRYDEIRTMMQMVKSVGQLPNTIYLLAYDRDVVWHALEEREMPIAKHPWFGEKIVQQEVELPTASRTALLRMFEKETQFILKAFEPDQLRWINLIHHGLHRWIHHPRDVMRFANALRFAAPSLIEEIDPQDLLGMEGLRLFDRQVFEWIRTHGDLFFGEGQYQFRTSEQRGAVAQELRNAIPEADREDLTTLVADLFPQIAGGLLNQRSFSQRTGAAIRRARGVATRLGYDAYFSLFPSPDGVPKALIDECITRIDDEEWLTSTIKAIVERTDRQGQRMIGEFMGELGARLPPHHSPEPTSALLKALIRNGDAIFPLRERPEMLMPPPGWGWSHLIEHILRYWGPERAGTALVELIDEIPSPSVWASIYVDRGHELKVLSEPRDTQEPLITQDAFNALSDKLRRLIEARAKEGSLASAPLFHDLIVSWKYLAGNDPVRTWIDRNLANAEFFYTLSRSLLIIRTGSGGRSYRLGDGFDSEVFDPAGLSATATTMLEAGHADEDQRDRLRAIIDGTEKFLSANETADPDSDDV